MGRKTVTIISLLMSGFAFALVPFVPEGSPEWVSLLLYLLGKWGNIMIWPALLLFQTELFPTTVRNSANGLIGLVGTIGGFLAPIVAKLVSAVAVAATSDRMTQTSPIRRSSSA